VLTGSNRRHSPCKGCPAAQAANLGYKAVWQLFDSVGDELIKNLVGGTAVARVEHRRVPQGFAMPLQHPENPQLLSVHCRQACVTHGDLQRNLDAPIEGIGFAGATLVVLSKDNPMTAVSEPSRPRPRSLAVRCC
jgi:hypothetical protein